MLDVLVPPLAAAAKAEADAAAGGLAESSCTICLDAPATHAFVPCGHQCVCLGCLPMLEAAPPMQCPMCRAVATSAIQVFRA